MKKQRLLQVAVPVLCLMLIEWRFIAWRTEGETIRHYHGLCNAGVGRPYADFVHELRNLQETGETNKLARVLRAADDRSADIFDVWLRDKPSAYRTSIDEILE